jgi:hypothetical protein
MSYLEAFTYICITGIICTSVNHLIDTLAKFKFNYKYSISKSKEKTDDKTE